MRVDLDLNCDLGEGEPPSRTRALMRCVTSANVACGGHAGDLRSMRFCVRLAAEHHVHLGAHPGTWDRANFGRTAVKLSPDESELLLLQQVGALEHVARAEGVSLHHIKLHGALYHATEQDHRLARRYLDVVRHHWPKRIVYALARGRVAGLAREVAVAVWEEAFVDRRYRSDGSLLSRRAPNAVHTGPEQVRDQARLFLDGGEVVTENGRRIRLNPRTLCLHGDTPHAARLAAIVAREFLFPPRNMRKTGSGRRK